MLQIYFVSGTDDIGGSKLRGKYYLDDTLGYIRASYDTRHIIHVVKQRNIFGTLYCLLHELTHYIIHLIYSYGHPVKRGSVCGKIQRAFDSVTIYWEEKIWGRNKDASVIWYADLLSGKG